MYTTESEITKLDLPNKSFKTPTELLESGDLDFDVCLCGRNHIKGFKPHSPEERLQEMLNQRAN